MNILAIGAHPDDVEHNCAGTMAKVAKQGHKVFIATATNILRRYLVTNQVLNLMC